MVNKGLRYAGSKKDTKSSESNTQTVQVFIGVGLATGIGLIIAGGWLIKNEENPVTSTRRTFGRLQKRLRILRDRVSVDVAIGLALRQSEAKCSEV